MMSCALVRSYRESFDFFGLEVEVRIVSAESKSPRDTALIILRKSGRGCVGACGRLSLLFCFHRILWLSSRESP